MNDSVLSRSCGKDRCSRSTGRWGWETVMRGTATVAYIAESVIGRPISRLDALRIARQIIECAEQERIQLAKWEGERGIQWEDG